MPDQMLPSSIDQFGRSNNQDNNMDNQIERQEPLIQKSLDQVEMVKKCNMEEIQQDEEEKQVRILDENCVRSNKKELNDNAMKFRLRKLYSTSIRYEVIYKNMLRDIRKFYSVEFNNHSQFIKRKRKHGDDFFFECLGQFVDSQFKSTFEAFGT